MYLNVLLVIDAQEGFVTKEAKKLLGRLVKKASKTENIIIIATKFINTPMSNYVRLLNWDKMQEYDPAIKIIDEIQSKAKLVIEKNTYGSNELINQLKGLKPEKVFIAGADTDACVLKIAYDLFDAGFTPLVLEEYCMSSGGMDMHQTAIAMMERNIGKNSIIKTSNLDHIF